MTRLFAALVVCGTMIAPAAPADEPKGDAAEPVPPQTRRLILGRDAEPSFWIGAMCAPADPTLRAQLGIDAGLTVAGVAPDSPAAKAGLKPHDVIVRVGDEPARDLAALVEAVNKAGDKELKLEIRRGGKPDTLTVQPAKRPEGAGPPLFAERLPEGFGDPRRFPEPMRRAQQELERILKDLPPGEEAKRLREWLEKNRADGLPFRMHMFGPGVIMQQHGAALPGGTSVTIKKEGNEPAAIHVERGDQKWDLTEQQLDKLPPDLRGPVGAMLGGAAAGAVVFGSGGPGKVQVEIKTDEGALKADQIVVSPGAPAADRQVLEEMKKLHDEIDALRKQLDELKKNTPPAKKPAKEKV